MKMQMKVIRLTYKKIGITQRFNWLPTSKTALHAIERTVLHDSVIDNIDSRKLFSARVNGTGFTFFSYSIN